MSQINFGLLNTNAPYEIGTSFQRGMDEAMLRQQAIAKFEADKRQRDITNQYNQQQQELLRMNYQNDADKIKAMREKDMLERKRKQAEDMFYLPKFLKDAGIQAEGVGMDEEGNFIGPSGQPVDLSQLQVSATQQPTQNEEWRDLLMSGMSNPKTRSIAMREAFRMYREQGKTGKEDDFTRWMNMTPEQRQQYETFKGIGKSPLIEKGAFSITNEMGGEAAKMAAKKEGMDIGEQAAMIENKYSALDSVREAKAILSKGIYAGTYGDFKKMLAKGSFGAIGDRQKAINTEEFISYVGNTVVPRLKEFGGNDSNEEMRYLKSIMGGDTSMEPEAIARIIDSAERKIQRGIERLQRQRGAIEQGAMPDLGPGPSRTPKNQAIPAARPSAQAPFAGKLSPAEQKELDDLRRRFGK